MRRVLIVHASRHGGTAGIAERIGEVLRSEGVEAVVAAASDMPDPRDFDASIIGSGVYIGSWLKEGTRYLERHAATLATRPCWLFSSGPLPGSSRQSKGPAADPVDDALGPREGSGSGGRKKIEELSAAIHPVGHRVFLGAYDPTDPPRSMSERLVRLTPAAKDLLPAGDFREWPVIEAWAREIGAKVTGLVPVG